MEYKKYPRRDCTIMKRPEIHTCPVPAASVRRRHVGPYKPYRPVNLRVTPNLVDPVGVKNGDKKYILRSSDENNKDESSEKDDVNIDFSVEPSQSQLSIVNVSYSVIEVEDADADEDVPEAIEADVNEIVEERNSLDDFIQQDANNLEIPSGPLDTSKEVEEESSMCLIDVSDSESTVSFNENSTNKLLNEEKNLEIVEQIEHQVIQNITRSAVHEDEEMFDCFSEQPLPTILPETTNTSRESLKKDHFKTYIKEGYELRHCQINVEDCLKDSENEHIDINHLTQTQSGACTKSKSNITNDKSSFDNNKTIKSITTDVSSESYCETFEESVARKLALVRRNLAADETLLRNKLSLFRPLRKNKKVMESTYTPSSAVCYEKSDISRCENEKQLIPISSNSESSTPETSRKIPIHPRMKLNNLINASKSPPESIETVQYQTENELQLAKNSSVFEVTDSESTVSAQSDDELNITTDLKEEPADNTSETQDSLVDESPSFQLDSIKEEKVNREESFNTFYLSDDDEFADILEAYKYVERRRRKVSSKARIESFVMKASPTPKVQYLSPTRRRIPISDYHVDRQHANHCSKHLQINVVRLQKETIDNLITCCQTKDVWSDKDVLRNAGLSLYDINRLCISLRRPSKDAKYKLRQFIKRNIKFESKLNEKPTVLKLTLSKAEKLEKRRLKQKEKQDEEQKDLESIRRSLLKINAKFLNQRKFWCRLDKGSSSHPIVL